MSRHGTILQTRGVVELGGIISEQVEAWYSGAYAGHPYPRSKWLSDLESELRRFWPQASSRDLNVTARSLAPFPLREPNANRT